MVRSKNNKIARVFLITLIISFGIIIRVLIVPAIQGGDILVHQEWSRTIYQKGTSGSYFFPVWTYTPPTQPPAMMLGFWFSQHIYQNRYLLSQLHNLSHFPPTAAILWFDKNGEILLLKTWAIIGDVISALVAFYVINKLFRKSNLSIFGLIAILFNPLSIYESAYWGQNDILSSAFTYLGLLTFLSPTFGFLSIPLFVAACSLKPTVIILTPVFILIFLKNFNQKHLRQQLIGLVLGTLLLLASFKPFLLQTPIQLKEISTIVTGRIATSSKGVIRASNSAFNFYSLFFTLDQTPGNFHIFFLNLNQIGIICFLLLISITILHIFKNRPLITSYLFYFFFVSQGAFLFVTGMLERYFFPAFLASVILMVVNHKGLGKYFFFQNILWFLNLSNSRSNSILLIKTFSLLSIINFFIISSVYFFHKQKLPNNEIR